MSQYRYGYEKRKFIFFGVPWRVFLEEFPSAMVAAQGYKKTVAYVCDEDTAHNITDYFNDGLEESYSGN